jgi:flagellar secretion chaperone FliS
MEMVNMLDKKNIEKRISSANDIELVAILYEALIDNFNDSILSIDEKKYDELKDINKNSRDILAELLATLEGNSEIAINLRQIYIYVNKLITEGENRKDKNSFEMATKIIRPLYEGFSEIGKNIEPKVVTGLTYGKSNLDEYQMKGNKTFKG